MNVLSRCTKEVALSATLFGVLIALAFISGLFTTRTDMPREIIGAAVLLAELLGAIVGTRIAAILDLKDPWQISLAMTTCMLLSGIMAAIALH